jgi:stringent starvation protein B
MNKGDYHTLVGGKEPKSVGCRPACALISARYDATALAFIGLAATGCISVRSDIATNGQVVLVTTEANVGALLTSNEKIEHWGRFQRLP